jgi:predicted  nucleic acid-binding Zn-ribbon protein
MEEARAEEKDKLNSLKATLYEKQRQMQDIQSELEQISQQNSALEQDFANEIGRKNQNSKEVG